MEGGGAGLVLVILTLGTCSGQDYRTVPYEALLPNMDTFTDAGVSHFSEIVFHVKMYQIIVGARDALYRLSMDGLKKMEKGRNFSSVLIFVDSLHFSRVVGHCPDGGSVHCQGPVRGSLQELCESSSDRRQRQQSVRLRDSRLLAQVFLERNLSDWKGDALD